MINELRELAEALGDEHELYHDMNECADELECNAGDGYAEDLLDQLGLETKVISLPSSGLINMPGMISNYLYAVSVKDHTFANMFESWFPDAPAGLFPAIRAERFTVSGTSVLVEVYHVEV